MSAYCTGVGEPLAGIIVNELKDPSNLTLEHFSKLMTESFRCVTSIWRVPNTRAFIEFVWTRLLCEDPEEAKRAVCLVVASAIMYDMGWNMNYKFVPSHTINVDEMSIEGERVPCYWGYDCKTDREQMHKRFNIPALYALDKGVDDMTELLYKSAAQHYHDIWVCARECGVNCDHIKVIPRWAEGHSDVSLFGEYLGILQDEYLYIRGAAYTVCSTDTQLARYPSNDHSDGVLKCDCVLCAPVMMREVILTWNWLRHKNTRCPIHQM
jgi:hypothetical protein